MQSRPNIAAKKPSTEAVTEAKLLPNQPHFNTGYKAFSSESKRPAPIEARYVLTPDGLTKPHRQCIQRLLCAIDDFLFAMSTLSLLVGLLLDDSAEEAQSRYGHVTHKGVQEERPVTAVLPTPQRHSPVDRYVTRAGHGGTPARHQQLRHACRSRGHPRTSSTATSRVPVTAAPPHVINSCVTRAGQGGIPARHQQLRHACRSRRHPRTSSPHLINSCVTRPGVYNYHIFSNAKAAVASQH